MSASQFTADRSEELLHSATERVKRGDLEQARAELAELLDIEPQHPVAVGMLAAVYAELKIPERAVEYFQRALDLHPDNVLARFQLGLLQLDLQQPQTALETWQPGEYGPNEYLVKYHSGIALMQLDQPGEALARFREAQQFMPIGHALYPQLLAFLMKLGG